MSMRILHIAPTNISGVPGQFVQAERRLGFDSLLVTLFRDPRKFPQDLCLNLPFIDNPFAKWIKRRVSLPQRLAVDNVLRIPERIPKTWKPHTAPERWLVRWRDAVWRPRIEKAIEKYGLDRYDVYQLDGGLGFYRSGRFIRKMKERGKKIICCYTGSDLRVRGVIPAIDRISDLNVSVEFDHTLLHPNLYHVFFPFDASRFQPHRPSDDGLIRIGHAPTSRAAKGSDIIIPVLRELEEEFPVRMVLIEGLSYEDAIREKQKCDIFVDQIGDLGYGINSLESLAMGIPTCSCLAPGFAEAYPDHPFVEVNGENLKAKLIRLIRDEALRKELGERGRRWVVKYHDAVESVKRIHRLAGIDE